MKNRESIAEKCELTKRKIGNSTTHTSNPHNNRQSGSSQFNTKKIPAKPIEMEMDMNIYISHNNKKYNKTNKNRIERIQVFKCQILLWFNARTSAVCARTPLFFPGNIVMPVQLVN